MSAQIIDYTKISRADLDLKFPGEHIICDAQMAVAASMVAGLDSRQAVFALNLFAGTWRRFEYKGLINNQTEVYDDYAHHPNEVKVTLKAMQEKYPAKKIIAVFQPHLYSRTKALLTSFADSLSLASKVVLLPIYAAREKDDGSVTSQDLAVLLQKKGVEVYLTPDFTQAEKVITEKIDVNSVVLVMGAGDITNLATSLVKEG